LGISQNDFEAAKYFRLAADQGDFDAMFAYAVCLAKGLGVSQNVTEAARYFRLAAGGGSPDTAGELPVALKQS
jgi:TPR repeat protein